MGSAPKDLSEASELSAPFTKPLRVSRTGPWMSRRCGMAAGGAVAFYMVEGWKVNRR